MNTGSKTVSRTVTGVPGQAPPTLDLDLNSLQTTVGVPLAMTITTGGDTHGTISNAKIGARITGSTPWIEVGTWPGQYGVSQAEVTISQAQVDSGDFDELLLDVRIRADYDDYTPTVYDEDNKRFNLLETPLDFSYDLWEYRLVW